MFFPLAWPIWCSTWSHPTWRILRLVVKVITVNFRAKLILVYYVHVLKSFGWLYAKLVGARDWVLFPRRKACRYINFIFFLNLNSLYVRIFSYIVLIEGKEENSLHLFSFFLSILSGKIYATLSDNYTIESTVLDLQVSAMLKLNFINTVMQIFIWFTLTRSYISTTSYGIICQNKQTNS